MISFGRFIAAEEERLALEDDPFKNAGALRLGSFDPDRKGDFATIDEMIAAVDEEMRTPEQFFEPPIFHASEFELDEQKLTFKSALPDGSRNDYVHAQLIGRLEPRRRAVIIIPHWNSRSGAYTRLATILSWFGFAVLVLTLPHHLTRASGDPSQVANDFLNANLGATIRSVRQSVADVRLLAIWLRAQGCKEVNLVGVSLGSCIGSLAAAFDGAIGRTALLLTAGDFAETVWTGRATAHIRRAIENGIDLHQLRRIWSLLSPINFVDRFARNGSRMMIVSGRRDEVVKFDQAEAYAAALRKAGVQLRWHILPCGHYTLGELPFSVISLCLTLLFLRRSP